MENWTHDFNIGSMVRTANAFTANRVHIVGPHKWNRKGALMTELYQHVVNHPSIQNLVDDWHTRIAAERAEAERHIAELEPQLLELAPGDPRAADLHAGLKQARHQLHMAQHARVIALDIVPGAAPIETYDFPERCLMLFGAGRPWPVTEGHRPGGRRGVHQPVRLGAFDQRRGSGGRLDARVDQPTRRHSVNAAPHGTTRAC